MSKETHPCWGGCGRQTDKVICPDKECESKFFASFREMEAAVTKIEADRKAREEKKEKKAKKKREKALTGTILEFPTGVRLMDIRNKLGENGVKISFPCSAEKYVEGCQCAKCYPIALMEAHINFSLMGAPKEMVDNLMDASFELMKEQIRNGGVCTDPAHGHPPGSEKKFPVTWLKRALRTLAELLERPVPVEAQTSTVTITADEVKAMTDEEFLNFCGMTGKDPEEEKAA